MAVILTILCGMYGTYCTAFCCTMGYTLYKENREEKEKRKIKIKLEYIKLQMNELSRLDMNFSKSNFSKSNFSKSSQNEKLQSISEVDEFIDSDSEDSGNRKELL